ncbi:MAG: D-alanyl-D-alanine carboxypeptidase/D-alanyl-D-alanine-endopeptidase [Bryobacterales bacterium]|nr:D-alanyl-D-alanine carboxypeptidase/D-alanyl-D-alanine-endopeptidase [Bryobacterales bacterium]
MPFLTRRSLGFLPFLVLLGCLLLLPLSPPGLGLAAQQLETPRRGPSKSLSLPARLSKLWRRETLPTRAFAGLAVVDAVSGETIASENAAYLFVPASNVKLYSTALALHRLGPEHRVSTQVLAGGSFDEPSGVLRGNLILQGGGDPSMSSRRFPYSIETEDLRDYPIPALEELADELLTRGIRQIDGDVIGDDSKYVWEPFHEGWAQDDALYGYGAPVSALSVNDNLIEITVAPAAVVGEPATVSIRPALPYYDILNRAVTTAKPGSRIEWERAPGQQLILRGGIAPRASAWKGKVAIDDPALYAARYLRDALLRRGVRVSGGARARHQLAGAASGSPPADSLAVLARHQSPPVAEIVHTVNKESMNLFAEMLLLEVAHASGGTGSREQGLRELRNFLAGIGIAPDAVSIADASGLARLNLVSPQATVQLLRSMWRGPHRQIWLESLPVGGRDGTLERRFGDSPLASSIRAKTGSLRGVSALSGYATTRSGKTFAFSAFVNNHPGSSRIARDFLDRIALEIAGSP